MSALGTGWGKLLLFGEHAAVYGHPAVGLSLDTRTTVELEMDERPKWRFEGIPEGRRLEPLLLLYEKMFLPLRRKGRGTVRITSSIPRELGFGSSAALCVALAAAFTELSAQGGERGAGPTQKGEAHVRRLWELAHRGEAFFHGTPSGIDTGLSLHRGLHCFTPHPPGLPDTERLPGFPLFLVVGAVPRCGSTGTLVGGLRNRVESGDREVIGTLQRLGELAGGAIRLFREDSGGLPRGVGDLAWEAQEGLRSLGLSTPGLDRLLEEGRKAGAVGGKLSGAGGGGAFFLVCESRKAAGEVEEKLATAMRKSPAFDGGFVRVFGWTGETPDSP